MNVLKIYKNYQKKKKYFQKKFAILVYVCFFKTFSIFWNIHKCSNLKIFIAKHCSKIFQRGNFQINTAMDIVKSECFMLQVSFRSVHVRSLEKILLWKVSSCVRTKRDWTSLSECVSLILLFLFYLEAFWYNILFFSAGNCLEVWSWKDLVEAP